MGKSRYSDVINFLEKRKYAASSDTIANTLGCSVKTVRRHLRTLRQHGLLDREPLWLSQFGYTWVYSLKEKEAA